MWHRVSGALKGPPVLEVYCDGSAAERVGKPGGWAFALVRGGEVLLVRSGFAPETTSLTMELQSALAGLGEVLRRGWEQGHAVELISDSSIALDVAAGKFLPKRPLELAVALRETAARARVTTRWVRAHSGHPWNELVDALADEAKRAGLE